MYKKYIKIYKILKIIFFFKFNFFPPSKKKILFYDIKGLQFFKKIFNLKEVEILHTRYEQINFFILFKNLLNFKFNAIEYFNTSVSFVKTKIIITFADNYSTFYKLKNFESSKKIFVQNAWRSGEREENLFTFKLNKKISNFTVDYMFVFNKHIGKKYNSFINGKYFATGSLRSNSVEIINNKKMYDILFISTFRKLIIEEKKNKFLEKVIKNLKNFSLKYNKKIFIYVTPKKYQIHDEKNFYKSILGHNNEGKNWEYIENNPNKTYEYVDKSKLVVSTDSTLLYESLSRGVKTIFFDGTSVLDKNYETRRFGWPMKTKKNGLFWTTKIDQNSCNRIMKKIIQMKIKKWKSVCEKYSKEVMIRDFKNSKLRKTIKSLI